jgi:multiple sugar transport system permease protein
VTAVLAWASEWKDFRWPLLVEYGYSPRRETLNVGIWQVSTETR